MRASGRRLGQDTRQVLREMLGLSDGEVDRLAAARIVALDAASMRDDRAPIGPAEA